MVLYFLRRTKHTECENLFYGNRFSSNGKFIHQIIESVVIERHIHHKDVIPKPKIIYKVNDEVDEYIYIYVIRFPTHTYGTHTLNTH
jgi:hypothetical protein